MAEHIIHEESKVSVIIPDSMGVREATGTTLRQFTHGLPFVVYHAAALDTALADWKSKARLRERATCGRPL